MPRVILATLSEAKGRRESALRGFVVAAVTLFALATSAAAQQADVIRGRVTSASAGDMPIENALITATSAAGGINRTTRTDRDGRYTITFPGGDGDYWITVVAIGYTPRRLEVKRTIDQAILIGDIRLTTMSSTLDTVLTQGQRPRPLANNNIPDISGTDRPVNAGLVPVEQMGDLASMAASLPGVLFIPGTNGDPSGFSVLGLEALQNGLTINGMSSLASDLPRDGDYALSVATSPYDVSQGQFSGARVNIRIPSGSNYILRRSSVLANAPQLQWTDATGRALGQRFGNVNASGAIAGPISFDKAFYNLSYELGRHTNDVRTLLNTDPLGLQSAGIAADSARRLRDLLDGVRVPATVPGFPSDQLSDRGRVLANFDFFPLSSASGQTFKMTINGAWNRTSPLSSGATVLPASTLRATNWDAAVQGRHSGYYGVGILSETGVALSTSRRFTTPYLDLPSGRVLVSSLLDGQSAVQSIAFGGAPARTSTTVASFDVTNELSWFSINNKHRIKLGSEIRHDTYSLDQSNNRLGTFAFNSLADLQFGRPASFTRQLTPIANDSREVIGGLYVADYYRVSPDIQVLYGARLDANRFLNRPATNADVERLYGARNDRLPDGVFVSPRVGFSWTYGTASQIAAFQGSARVPRAIIQGGVGVFQNALNVSLPGQAIANTGLPDAVRQLSCTGAAAPVPAWSSYIGDPASIPSTCRDGNAGTVFASTAPNVTLFSRDYAPQRSLRANLQWTGGVLGNRLLASINGTYSQNSNQTGFVDRNLDPFPRFTLGGETNRPVFVQPTSIVPGTGAIASADGRISPLYNHVTELRSDLESVSRQLVVQLSPVVSTTRYTWGFNYVLNSVRERTNGFASTVGNPFDVTAGRSPFDWRHQIQFDVGYNFFDTVRLFWIQSFFSGFPYTPVVAGDVNGDGYASNDRAFVFDPARTTDATLATSMKALLDGSAGSARDCLNGQLGTLAARNSCEGPWTSAASMAIAFNPAKVRMPQRTNVSFSVANPLGAADLLLHGESGLHGWGQSATPDPRLLVVRGFDPQTRSFKYEVNQRFGNTSQATSAARNPVTITARVQVDVGPPRERQDLTRALDRGRTNSATKVSAAEIRSMYGSAGLVNPMATMLRSSDSLHLTGPQADSLATLNRWYVVRLDSIWAPVALAYASLPERYDQSAAYERYRRAREASVDLIIKVAPGIHDLLSAEQRRKLPQVVASYLDRRYLAAVRSGTQGLTGPVFPTGVGVPSAGGQGRGGRGGGGL